MPDWRFKVLFDSECPFCRVEAHVMTCLNRKGHLALEDIAAPGFESSFYGSTFEELMGTLHGFFPDGGATHGMETFRQAYRAVGLGWLFAPTGWPTLRPLFDFAYVLFAKHRVRLGRLFGRDCAGDRCSVP